MAIVFAFCHPLTQLSADIAQFRNQLDIFHLIGSCTHLVVLPWNWGHLPLWDMSSSSDTITWLPYRLVVEQSSWTGIGHYMGILFYSPRGYYGIYRFLIHEPSLYSTMCSIVEGYFCIYIPSIIHISAILLSLHICQGWKTCITQQYVFRCMQTLFLSLKYSNNLTNCICFFVMLCKASGIWSQLFSW